MGVATIISTALMLVVAVVPACAQMQHYTSITEYLPEGCALDGSVDMTEPITKAFAECQALYFPGGNDPENPVIYTSRPGLVSQERAHIVFGPNTLLRRLPGEKAMIRLERGARLSGCVMDGNKYGHWPEFQDLGKGDWGILTTNENVVVDCFVYNTPGIAFGGYCNDCKFVRCRAENAGYIDVKFGADYYQGKWDNWSGDGFYIRGHGNLVRDCEAYDTFRWDLCASHSGARDNTFVDCRGGDVNWRTYGFVDIEGAEPNNRLIRCISPNSHMSISTPYTELIECVAAGFGAGNADHLRMINCTALSDGIALGRFYENQWEKGGAAPIITGNRIFMSGPKARYGDYALAIKAEGQGGVVAGNMIYVHEDEDERGEAIRTEGCEEYGNQVIAGQWDTSDLYARPRLLRGWVDWDHIGRLKLAVFEEMFAGDLAEMGIEGEPSWQHTIIGEVPFAIDANDAGVAEEWFVAGKQPNTRGLRVGWPWNKQIGNVYVPGWYFMEFTVPAEQKDARTWIYFGGVDSEAVVWLNGEKLGEHDGWKDPFWFEATGKIKPGEDNRLVVRAYTTGGLAGAYGPIAVATK